MKRQKQVNETICRLQDYRDILEPGTAEYSEVHGAIKALFWVQYPDFDDIWLPTPRREKTE